MSNRSTRLPMPRIALSILAAVMTLATGQVEAAKWWQPVGTGVTGNQISQLYVWGDSLVVGGQFSNAGGVPANNIAVWDGASWSALGAGLDRVDGIAEYNGQLVVAGVRSGGVEEVVAWNGSSWDSLVDWRGALTGFQGKLYGIGTETYGPPPGYPCRGTRLYEFDGTGWSSVRWWGQCDGGSYLMDMKVIDGMLHAYIYHEITLSPYPRWCQLDIFDGASWSTVPGFDQFLHFGRLAKWNGTFYASALDYYGDNTIVMKWDDPAWTEVYSGGYLDGCLTYSMVEYDGQLVMGGWFHCQPYPASVLSYDGVDWTALGDAADEVVDQLIVYDGTLIAAGRFNTIGPVSTPLIAQYVDVITSVEPAAPASAVLHRSHPNPFNPATVIPYTLSEPGHVSLVIFGPDGRAIRTLVDADRPAGDGSVTWDGADDHGNSVSSGVYFCRLTFNGDRQSRKLVLIK